MTTEAGYTVEALLSRSEATVERTYRRLVEAIRGIGPVVEDAKKTSVHLAVPGGPAFAGVHPRRAALLLNIRSDSAIESPRVRKVEQVSRNRFHNELLLSSPNDVDAELVGWLAAAYGLAAGKAGG